MQVRMAGFRSTRRSVVSTTGLLIPAADSGVFQLSPPVTFHSLPIGFNRMAAVRRRSRIWARLPYPLPRVAYEKLPPISDRDLSGLDFDFVDRADGRIAPGPVQRAHPLEKPAPVRRQNLEPLIRPRGSKEVAKNGKVAAAIEEAMREDVASSKARKAGEVDYIRDPCLLNPALPQCKKPDPRAP